MAATADRAANEFAVVAWDEPGAGRSSDVPSDFTLADYADCLAGLIVALDLGPAHIAGLSWGGTVALELYRRHPGLVATLILVDTYAGWKGSLRASGGAGPRRGPPADARRRRPPVRSDVARAVRRRSAGRIRPAARGDGRRRSPREHEDCAACDGRGRPARPAARIAVPTLLIWGELDARSPLTVARQFEQAIPGAKLVVIPGAGHVSNLEQPEPFNDAVREFCRAHSPRSA